MNVNRGDMEHFSGYIDWLNAHCPRKMVTAMHAVSKIRRGNCVFIGTGCGEPQSLIRAMAQDETLYDIVIYQMLSETIAEYVEDDAFLRRFSLKLFFISYYMRKAAFEGKVDYIPAYLSQIPGLFDEKRIGLDVALIQVSPPDRFGYCSMGVSVDITRAGMENSNLIIAQVNPKMPRTWGDSIVHVDRIDYLVLHEEPLHVNLPRITESRIAERIGHYISQLVPDGATLQIGFGQLPYAILQYLDGKRDLGIHTQLITDAFLPLFEKKVITNKKKSLLPGRVVASLCMGSEKIYDYIHENPMFYFRSSDFVNDPAVIARNDNLVSISSALEVDLTGQVCSDSMGYVFFSGIGDQVDFLRGSAMSKGGFSVIALPSTAQNGKVSRIVSHLSEGAGVATTRGDIDFVVTEYGIAELHGKSIYQRVIELAQIAHPKFREELIQAAKKHHYIFQDQLPPHQDDLIFLEGYKTTFQLKDKRTIEFRPLMPSDEFGYRTFFYSLQEDTIYYRFFHHQRTFSHETAQQHWASVDYRKNMSLVGIISHKGRKEMIAVGSYARDDTMAPDQAEVALVVREDFQGMGVGTRLLESLEAVAGENGYKGFVADVLAENTGMIHVFKKRYPHAEITRVEGGDVHIKMEFSDGQ
jgi:acyl-CoA hydrolase/RimJ/RimL family protein N-acetyltransferase